MRRGLLGRDLASGRFTESADFENSRPAHFGPSGGIWTMRVGRIASDSWSWIERSNSMRMKAEIPTAAPIRTIHWKSARLKGTRKRSTTGIDPGKDSAYRYPVPTRRPQNNVPDHLLLMSSEDWKPCHSDVYESDHSVPRRCRLLLTRTWTFGDNRQASPDTTNLSSAT
jgi:hypothetical protein